MSVKEPNSLKPLKVAFLMQESRMGGIEYNSLHLAGALDKARFSVIFVCPQEGKLTSSLKNEKLKYLLYFCPPFLSTSTRFLKGYIFNPVATFYNFLNFPLIIWGLSRLFRKKGFSLVCTKGLLANFYGSLAARLAGIPCLWDMQEIVSKKKCFGFLSWILNKWADLFASKIILPAKAIHNQFSKKVQEKCEIIPNGIDVEKYHPGVDPQPVRKEWNVGPDEILIGHIARFTYWKGQKDFVKAAAQIAKEIPSAKFVLVGAPVFEDDSYEKSVKALAQDLGLNGRVLFPGFRDDLADVLAALDIFVHSSTEPEGCPLTLITAMAMGKPVVATDVSGNNEIITDAGQGLLVKPHCHEHLFEAILKIAKDTTLAQSLGNQARKSILAKYSVNAYVKGSSAVFQSIRKNPNV